MNKLTRFYLILTLINVGVILIAVAIFVAVIKSGVRLH